MILKSIREMIVVRTLHVSTSTEDQKRPERRGERR